MKLLQTITASGVMSFDFTNIPATGTDLYVEVSLYSNAASGTFESARLMLGKAGFSTSSVADIKFIQGTGTSATSGSSASNMFVIPTASVNSYGATTILIPSYASSMEKLVQYENGAANAATSFFIYKGVGRWTNTQAIDKLSIVPETANSMTGTVSLYLITEGWDGTALTSVPL